jgi:hypothetical protein
MNKDSKKKIIFKDDVKIYEFIKDIKEGLECMKQKNTGVFGDEDILEKLKSIEILEDWERNLLFMYVYFGSLHKMQKYTNVSYCTLSNTMKSVLQKVRLNF